jgi:hypothetical protein
VTYTVSMWFVEITCALGFSVCHIDFSLANRLVYSDICECGIRKHELAFVVRGRKQPSIRNNCLCSTLHPRRTPNQSNARSNHIDVFDISHCHRNESSKPVHGGRRWGIVSRGTAGPSSSDRTVVTLVEVCRKGILAVDRQKEGCWNQGSR